MRVVATADWHGELPSRLAVGLPAGDVLIVAGDVLPVWNHDRSFQAAWFRERLVPELEALANGAYELVVLIGGNHDFVLQDSSKLTAGLPSNVVYLQDSAVEHRGALIYGTPWANRFGRWAFMADEDELERIYEGIPEGFDVVVSHGPPYGLRDRTEEGHYVGSVSLLERLARARPRYVITGHIHEAYGRAVLGPTEVVNASLMNRRYSPVNPPVVIEL